MKYSEALKRYILEITPRPKVFATYDELRKVNIIPVDVLIEKYPNLYKRKLQLDRYYRYKEELVWEASRKGFYLRDEGMNIVYHLPVPPSWRESKKRKMHLQPMKSKPDCDNLTKAFLDILRPQQDESIWNIGSLSKLWVNAASGFIQIDILQPTIQREIPDPQQIPLFKRL